MVVSGLGSSVVVVGGAGGAEAGSEVEVEVEGVASTSLSFFSAAGSALGVD